MCELLAMSANTPTDLCFSFTGLTRRGGVTGPHKDGWGVAFYEGKGVRAFHDLEGVDPRAQMLEFGRDLGMGLLSTHRSPILTPFIGTTMAGKRNSLPASKVTSTGPYRPRTFPSR